MQYRAKVEKGRAMTANGGRNTIKSTNSFSLNSNGQALFLKEWGAKIPPFTLRLFEATVLATV